MTLKNLLGSAVMAKHIIKICGIRDPDMAEQAAIAGANLIGIVFHPASSRYVSLEKAISIATAARNAGALPVAVFVNHTDVEMQRISEATNIHIVQLHGERARACHHLLPKHYQRIYVQNISDDGDMKNDDGFQHLDSERDLILIDHEEPGQGNAINRLGFHYDFPFPWILAGGLSASNVVDAIDELQPNGVDVSSGVESSEGKKDIFLIKNFITSVRGYQHVI
jgi:phosphoribosylanthranilate isomerase